MEAPGTTAAEMDRILARMQQLQEEVAAMGDSERLGYPRVDELPGSGASGPYKIVTIDWTKDNVGRTAGRPVRRGSTDEDRKMLFVQQLVLRFLEPHFQGGWRLDGTYDQAVTYL